MHTSVVSYLLKNNDIGFFFFCVYQAFCLFLFLFFIFSSYLSQHHYLSNLRWKQAINIDINCFQWAFYLLIINLLKLFCFFFILTSWHSQHRYLTKGATNKLIKFQIAFQKEQNYFESMHCVHFTDEFNGQEDTLYTSYNNNVSEYHIRGVCVVYRALAHAVYGLFIARSKPIQSLDEIVWFLFFILVLFYLRNGLGEYWEVNLFNPLVKKRINRKTNINRLGINEVSLNVTFVKQATF